MSDSTANRGGGARPFAGWRALALLTYASSLGMAAQGTEMLDAPAGARALDFDPAGEQRLLASAGAGFRLARTSHFVVAYDVPHQTLSDLLRRLEFTYDKVQRFCRVRRIPLRVSGPKLQMTFYDRWWAYARRARQAGVDPEGTYGFYCQKHNQSFFCNNEHTPGMVRLREQVAAARENVERLAKALHHLPPETEDVRLSYPGGRTKTVPLAKAQHELRGNRRRLRRLEAKLDRYAAELNQTVIQHEAAHHILFAGGVHVRGADNPLWLTEGLAMQFETPPAGARRTPTTINHDRLDEFLRAHERGRLIRLRRLLSDRQIFLKNTTNRAICYAQAWALVYYLCRSKSDQFAAYVRASAVRRPGVPIAAEDELGDFFRFFGPMDEKFVARWEKHILELPRHSGETGQWRQ